MKTNEIKNETNLLIGFGSPIVDGIFSYASDPTLGEEIKKILNYHMSEDFPVEFYLKVLENDKTEKHMGGSALNTIRITNYVLHKIQNSKTGGIKFFGSSGIDNYGEFIEKSLEEEGITFFNQKFENTRTSTCIVLIENLDRSFFSDLGSSEKITVNFFEQHAEEIRNSKVFYADAYLIGKRFDCYKYVYETFAKEDILLAIGMASENIVRDFHDNLEIILPYLDIIFINNEEVSMFRANYNLQNLSIEQFMEFLSTKFDKFNKNKKRVIVNTRGTENTLIFVEDYIKATKEFLYIPINKVNPDLIVDLNGAGDAFSGGFLAGILNGYDISKSAKFGNLLAADVIQLKGFQIPKNLNEKDINEILNGNKIEEKTKIDL